MLSVRLVGYNGFSGLPGAPFHGINMDVTFIVTRGGKVGIMLGQRDGFPSYGIYAYSKGQPVRVLHEGLKTDPKCLSHLWRFISHMWSRNRAPFDFGVASVLALVSLVSVACQPQVYEYEIPGSIWNGWIIIVYDRSGCSPISSSRPVRVDKVGEIGYLCTSSSAAERLGRATVFPNRRVVRADRCGFGRLQPYVFLGS